MGARKFTAAAAAALAGTVVLGASTAYADPPTAPDGTRVTSTTPDGTRVTSTTPDGTRVTSTTPDGTRVTSADPDGTRVTLAAAPTTTPAPAARIYFTGSGSSTGGCPEGSGYACAVVPYGSGYYLFKFYKYGTYALHNWYGTGIFGNSQTGGAGAKYYDSSGRLLGCIPGPAPRKVYWTPVASIRLTVSGC